MRLLLLALLASLGFAGSAAAPLRTRSLDATAVERARQAVVTVVFAERAPPPAAPARVAAPVGQSSPPSRLADGSAGLLGASRRARLGRRAFVRQVASPPPHPDAPPRRRQPEGRGPPRGPRAA